MVMVVILRRQLITARDESKQHGHVKEENQRETSNKKEESVG